MTTKAVLELVVRKALAHGGLIRGLHESAKESRGLANDVTIEIKGTSLQVETAHRLIREFVSNHKELVTNSYVQVDADLRSYSSSSMSMQPYDGWYGSSGLGGAHVVMAVRNTNAGHELIKKWQEEWADKGLPLSVVKFSEAWNARSMPLYVLINNAGIFSIGEPQKFSTDGYEEHMQVNHLSAALLEILILPSLIRGTPIQIVNVNSAMHNVGFVDPEDMNGVSGKMKV